MRHLIKLKKLNRTAAHRRAMFVNMAVSLLRHEHIKTTLPKAKALRPIVEKLLTKAKKDTLQTKRYLFSKLKDIEIVNKLVQDIAPRNINRNGGYTRILKVGFRTGDVAPMAIIELVEKKSQKSTKKSGKESTKPAKESEPVKKVASQESESTGGKPTKSKKVAAKKTTKTAAENTKKKS